MALLDNGSIPEVDRNHHRVIQFTPVTRVILFLGVEAPVWQGARSAKDLSGTHLRASPLGVKSMDGLNNSQPIYNDEQRRQAGWIGA
jgi:hypothetical protein